MDYEYSEVKFISEGIELTGFITSLPGKTPPGVLFIHGGGKYATNLYKPWQEYMAENGFSSMSFFHRGVGTSNGTFESGSLNHRLRNAMDALTYFSSSTIVDPKKICVAGSSMGGHVAVRLIERTPHVKALILQSAAAYGKESEPLPLNRKFTAEISKPDNWKTSPVFRVLKNITIPVMVIYGELDTVIPPGVKLAYLTAPDNGLFVTIPNGGHTLLRPQTEKEAKARQDLFDGSVRFLQKVL